MDNDFATQLNFVPDGSVLIGCLAEQRSDRFFAYDAATGAPLLTSFSQAEPSDVERACAVADLAFDSYRAIAIEHRARFLDLIASHMEAAGDALIDEAIVETGLSRERLRGELARTTRQLRLFATVIRSGEWLGIRADRAQPERLPPRPELRLRHIPLGPIAIFGASNFPLAFSTAGGDTASALAAGCPVVVKGHPAHPGTGEIAARAVRAAAAECRMPDGVFSYLPSSLNTIATALAADSRIKAVAFTGSRTAGLALLAVATSRPEPIPVYAEMSSINPVVILPHALAERGDALAQEFIASLTLGAGQFCTNPGLILAVAGAELTRFEAAASATLSSSPSQTMLTQNIRAAYEQGVANLTSQPTVSCLARGAGGEGARGALFASDAVTFINDVQLRNEVFGACGLVVRCRDIDELRFVLESLEGQLTVTMHMDDADAAYASGLMPVFERKAGRIVANGWPTGVEVEDSMVHGGPFPATSDSRFTSVGTLAINRFLRPVCYQAMPGVLLPPELTNESVFVTYDD